MDLVAGILRFVGTFTAGVLGQLGLVGTVWAVIGLVLFGVIVKWLDRADRLFERFQRRWRKWSKGTRWSAMLLVAVFVGPAVWAAFPKTPGVAALALGGYTYYWYQGLRFVERYDLTEASAWQAWTHHLEVTRAARRHTGAITDATTKKGGRARKPTPHATGETFIAEPPFGVSAEDLAERYNAGEMTSAEKARTGKDIRGITGTPMPGGTVLVSIDLVDPDGGEPLAESRWWTP